jgi:hypothetical protein
MIGQSGCWLNSANQQRKRERHAPAVLREQS